LFKSLKFKLTSCACIYVKTKCYYS